jgi:hypothetical protein
MQKILLIIFSFLSFALFAENKVDNSKEAKALEWLNNQPLEFIENKEQLFITNSKASLNTNVKIPVFN